MFPMDHLLANGWGLHSDIIAWRLSPEERQAHTRVHHWNGFINEMRTSEGLLPTFTADVVLPLEVSSRRIQRRSGKASRWGSKVLVVDLLVEDSKVPATGKKAFDLVDHDDDAGTGNNDDKGWPSGTSPDDLTIATQFERDGGQKY